jgi:rod shape determining protein RodA
MKSRSLFGIDIALLVATLTLTVIGILFIYSSNLTSTGVIYSNEYIKQIVWVLTGTGILLFFAFFDYGRLNDLSPYFYAGTLALLAYALFFGRIVNGARSWLGFTGGLGIQPSEFAKIATILFFARFLERSGSRIRELPVFIAAMVVAFAPVALILLQPDLGTSLVYIPIFLAMSYMAGAKIRHLMFLLLTGSILILFTVLPAWETHIARREIPIIKILTDLRLTFYTSGCSCSNGGIITGSHTSRSFSCSVSWALSELVRC